MLIICLVIGIALACDALCWLAVGLDQGRWPTSRPMVAWPFIWFKRAALRPRGRWM